MNTNFKNLVEFQQYFKDEEACRKHLELQRWGGSPICPFCQSGNVYRFKDGKIFKCADKTCNKKFTVTVGTIYENSKIPLQKWFLALYIAGNHKKGISSLQLSRDLGITQKSAWFVLHRIREMLRERAPHMVGGTVEIDETYVGGKNRNKHENKKTPSAGGQGKQIVFGILVRGKGVRAAVVPDTNILRLQGIIRANVSTNCELITDSHSSYVGLKFHGYANHTIVKTEYGNYKTDRYFHTNNIEGFWSLFKRGIYGIYHQVSPKHLQRYVDEFTARYNSRKIKDVDRFEVFVSNSEGRLKYKDLIAK